MDRSTIDVFEDRAAGCPGVSKSYVHLPRHDVPLALRDLHGALAVGATLELLAFVGDQEHGAFTDDDVAERRFPAWPPALLLDVVAGAGFTVESWTTTNETEADEGRITVRATRARSLADTVGRGMRVLVCGLNPSVYSAEAGTAFFRPGNRFWPAALATGLAERDRDPLHALVRHGTGMTDLVKRATPRADDLTKAEYCAGIERLERLVAWLQPGAVCFVGLAGWRAAVNRRALAGSQRTAIGGRPVYVMPNTSGANARSSLSSLTGHLRAALALADA